MLALHTRIHELNDHLTKAGVANNQHADSQAVAGLDRTLATNLQLTQIPHDARRATTPYIVRKFLPHRELNERYIP